MEHGSRVKPNPLQCFDTSSTIEHPITINKNKYVSTRNKNGSIQNLTPKNVKKVIKFQEPHNKICSLEPRFQEHARAIWSPTNTSRLQRLSLMYRRLILSHRRCNKRYTVKPRIEEKPIYSLKQIRYTRVLNTVTDRSAFRIGKDGDDRFLLHVLRPLESDNDSYDNDLVRYSVQEDGHNHIGNVENSYPVQVSVDSDETLPAHISQLQREHTNRPRIQNPARHPDYQTLQFRRDTFRSWPHSLDVQDIANMAQAGLFYTGDNDLVRCFHCGIGLKDWASSDDPLQVHIRHSPHCEFLRATIPQSEIEVYQELLPTTNGQNDTETDFHWHLRQNVSNAFQHPQAPYSRYRNPNYQEYDARVDSFSRWPSYIVQTPQQLAEAGFFYTGMEDIVRCYACDGGLRKWDAEDDPWIEHAHWFPHCVHVLRERGQEYVNLIQVAAADDHEEDAGDMARNMEHLYINSNTGRESDDPVYSPAAQTAMDFGFSRAAVKMAIEECNSKHIRWKAEDLINLLLQKQDKGEVLPTDSPRAQSPVLKRKFDVTTKDGILAEHEMLIRRLKCIICDVEDINVLFLPCAHHNMCMTCAEDVTMCPICGKTIKEKIKTFMS